MVTIVKKQKVEFKVTHYEGSCHSCDAFIRADLEDLNNSSRVECPNCSNDVRVWATFSAVPVEEGVPV